MYCETYLWRVDEDLWWCNLSGTERRCVVDLTRTWIKCAHVSDSLFSNSDRVLPGSQIPFQIADEKQMNQ
jgi:hypothetical protein